MKKMPGINLDSQDVAELQAMVKAMVKALMAEKVSLLEQFKLAIDRQFSKRAEHSSRMTKRRVTCSMRLSAKRGGGHYHNAQKSAW